jgi:hypothetical protein
MRSFLLRPLGLVALLAAGLPGRYCLVPSAAGQAAPLVQVKPYTYVEQMPQLLGGGGQAASAAAVQKHVVLPANAPAPTRRVFAQFIVGKQGQIEDASIVQATDPVVDAAVLAAVRQLPTFEPGRLNGQPVRVSLTLPIAPPGLVAKGLPPTDNPRAANEAAEAKTMRWGLATRFPSEADTTFLRRVLPASFPQSGNLLAATWQPRNTSRKQLFFSVPGSEDNDNAYGSTLFVLAPFQGSSYAVQAFTIPSLGDATSLTSLFFADVNQDDQKELLALSECSLRAGAGRETRYQTQVFQYLGLTSAGRPQYSEDPTKRPYLDGLDTAAKVRQALAQHQQQGQRLPPPPTTKVRK